jgi:type I restriction enzyme S subunit
MRKYDLYKDSGIEWIGQIPSHWELVPIKYTLSIPLTDGPHETPELVSEGIIFISAEAIKEDKIDFEKKRGNISIEDHERFSKKYKPQKGDVYMIKSGATTGNLARVETDTEFNIWSPLAAFRPDPEKMITDFLFFYMKSKRFFTAIELGWNYGTQQNIGMNVLENLRMAQPTIEEQTAIAHYLGRKTAEIDELIADKKRLLELYEEEKTAIINKAVTKGINSNVPMKDSGIEWLGEIPEHWESVCLKWVSKIYSGGTPSKNNEDFWRNGTIPWLNSGTVNQFFITEPSEFITEDALNSSSAKWISENSIVIALAGQGKTKGMAAQVMFECTCNQSMGVIVPNDKVDNRFLLYYLINNYQNIRNLGGGDKRDGINLEMVGGIPLPVIPIPEQKEIVNHIENHFKLIETKKAKTEKLIELLNEYRTSLISEVVTGKIKIID